MTPIDTTVDIPSPRLDDEFVTIIIEAIREAGREPDQTGALPIEGLRLAHAAGYLTATVGAQYGGPDVSEIDLTRILVTLGEADASVALLAANTLAAHRAQARHGHWPEDIYQGFVARSIGEPTLANTVRAEPELGAPARGGLPATTARLTDDGWVIDGHKSYATGGEGLAYQLVWVVAEESDGDPEAPRVGHVIVPGDASGIEWIHTWDHLGLRASNTHDVSYSGVTVPKGAFLEIPRQPDGRYVDPAHADVINSLGHAAIYVGVARAARTAFTRFARSRVPAALGRPISTTERVQQVAGEIEAQITQAETLLYGTLLRLDTGDTEVSKQLGLTKVQIVRSSIAAVNAAVAALGNPALTRHGNLERLLRDVLCARVHPPQEDAALISAGQRILND